MDAEPSALRSGRRWRRMPPPPSRGSKRPPASHAVQDATSSPGPTDSATLFSCSVCRETATDPVVTLCGHLFCWPCLYRWVRRRRRSRGACPVCKSAVVVEPAGNAAVTPIYGITGGRDQVGGVGGGGGGPSLEVPPRPRGCWAQGTSLGGPSQAFRQEVRELSRDADALEERMLRVMALVVQVWIPRLNADFLEITAQRNAAGNSVLGRRRRRRMGDASRTQSNSNDGGEDGVYRGTRSRRRQRDL